MNAVALVIPEFPANVRSDTYAVDYGRMLGSEWMARSTEWNAPIGGEEPAMDENKVAEFKAEVARIADQNLGHHEAVDGVDLMLVMQIVAYVKSRPAMGRADKVAMSAIACLSEHDPDLARSLMTQLAE